MTDIERPYLIIHADWGTKPEKRWMCVAQRHGDTYLVNAPQPVGDLNTFWMRTRLVASGGSVLVGFDYPIGLPQIYAEQVGVENFVDVLPMLGQQEWSDFYRIAQTAEEISLTRPFYPYGTRGTKRVHLTDGLGLQTFDQMLRRCERPTTARGAASPLFWTLGAKQAGRAAIIGWRDLLGPGLLDPQLDLRLWPFQGSLTELVASGAIVVAETYPAEACLHLGLQAPAQSTWSKTSQVGRKAQAVKLLDWAESRGVKFKSELVLKLQDGFGQSKTADDPFDATLGVLSMIEVCLGRRCEAPELRPTERQVEGWILGQCDAAEQKRKKWLPFG